ncbi:hypothetical protein GJAV_G00247830 [Gymnothorax javanicus]|nr:hypothetical protein GJAV_G00247830 [Gymnothorax javanicus]
MTGIMAAPLGRDTLPDHWSYGVCKDGRVFFINDKTLFTTWLHPRTGEPVNSGHMIRSDLPRGWEEGFTDEGASYFINHNQRTTSFRHPVTGQISPDNVDFVLREQPVSCMSQPVPDPRPSSMVSESSTAVTSSTVDTAPAPKGPRTGGKLHSFGKREQAIKRNRSVPVVVRGWLYKQDSSGMRLWKRKWFVLSDYCLFYYKDSREETVLGSIPLPSYVISPVEPGDHISRKYAFKACHTGMRSYIYSKSSVIGSQAEHCGMRTYFFSADTQEDMNGWIRAMNQAALMQNHSSKRDCEKLEKLERQAVQLANHVNSHSKSPALQRVELMGKRTTDVGAQGEVRAPQGQGERRSLERRGKSRTPSTIIMEADASPGPPHPASTVPTHRNGNGIPAEQNGNVVYKRGLVPRSETERQVQRKTTLAQVQHWVRAHKGEPKSSTEQNLPRRTPPMQLKGSAVEAYQSLPKTSRLSSGGSSPQAPRNLPSDYKYAQDRLSHFRMTSGERSASREGTVWQLYEWQQRQQFRHGSPTAPVYTPAPDYQDPTSFRITLDIPRCVSVPPSPSDIPPPGPPIKPLSPRRPHTPAERVTVRPLDEVPPADVPASGSPLRARPHSSKAAHVDRRSMPAMGYITHTPEELTLLLIQLRRHQAKMAGVRDGALANLQQLNGGPSVARLQADDTYMQLKKDLEYLDLKVTGHETLKDRSIKPVKIAESDVDVKLSRLCEQDKILQELETRVRTLKEDKDKLESVLDVSHQQMEQYRDQPAHAEKIAYQQRLLQEDVVHIRAELSQVSTEMEGAWNEYCRLELAVDQLRGALHDQMNRNVLSQLEKEQMRRELWRVEDVLAGLCSSKANYRVTIDSMKNPVSSAVPSQSAPAGEMDSALRHAQPANDSKPSQHLTLYSQGSVLHKSVPKWAEEDAPPRPPLPQVYSPEEPPPVVPPLPKETTVIRHMSVRGLKRQSDERKRDREVGHCVNGDYKYQVELRSYLSEPELLGVGASSVHITPEGRYQTLPSRGLSGSSSRLNQSTNISSYVTLRRGVTASILKERPKSALERLYSSEPAPRGRMSADEQLERMKRRQKALVRERKRTLSQGERQSSSPRTSSSSSRPLSADLGSWRREQEFDWQLLERAVQGEEQPPEHCEIQRPRSDEWLTVRATPMRELDLEPLEYDLDLNRELSKPEKVCIPERYLDLEPEEPLSEMEIEARHRKVERIKSILAKSSVQNLPPAIATDKPDVTVLDSALQEQERIITMSYALASEASQKSKEVAAKAVSQH